MSLLHPCPYGDDCGDMHCNGTQSEGCHPASGVGIVRPATAVFYGCRQQEGDLTHPDPDYIVVVADPGGLVYVHIECSACNPIGYWRNFGNVLMDEAPGTTVQVMPLFPKPLWVEVRKGPDRTIKARLGEPRKI